MNGSDLQNNKVSFSEYPLAGTLRLVTGIQQKTESATTVNHNR